jgi:cytochrome P450
MLHLVTKAPAIRERSGNGFFVPAHPEPLDSRGSTLDMILRARRDLLSIWTKRDYRTRVGAVRLLGRQVVLVNSPAAVKHVMVTRHENYERKSPQMRRALQHLLGDGLFISDGATWKSRRPLVTDIVHKNRLPTFGKTMQAVTADTTERWSRELVAKPFNMLGEMAELTAEIIARTVFGNELGAAAAHEVIAGFSRYQSLIDSVNLGYFLGADEGWRVLRGPRLGQAVGRVHGVIDRVIDDHLAGRGDHDSMVELLVRRQKKSPELGLDRTALRNEAATIFMAGHETTAATLTWAWYLLANSPWAEAAVHAEIAAVCGDRVPTVDDVARLDYCRAVIEETLRLYPPVPFLTRQARDTDMIGDIAVDPAALILVVPWLLHRASDLWVHPNRFEPERFLKDRPTPYSYAPFALGPRICAGLAFGLTESILCLAVIAQRFRIRVVEGHKVEPICRLTLRPKGGLPVTIEPR